MPTEFDINAFLIAEEQKLSPYAAKSSDSLGRRKPIKKDPFRLDFARDENRIIHSPPFRRLKHKTQVFLAPDNDHICTRMEHVLHVSSIASVIGRCLNLNLELIGAIAVGHDLGHPPFGHPGERTLQKILDKEGVSEQFYHEIHGLRVVDKLTNYGEGLNLTFEVRDGIVTHCGERFDRVLTPDRTRAEGSLDAITELGLLPTTLEGCLVRMVDRVAYLGRDLEDGLKAGVIRSGDIPREIVRGLGKDNGKIIGVFVNDIISHSIEKDRIEMSTEVHALMGMLKDFNYDYIYTDREVRRRAKKAARILELLYYELLRLLNESERGTNRHYVNELIRETPTLSTFFRFIKNSNYHEHTPSWRIVTDYIAGMTDMYAKRHMNELFLPSAVV
jgi:dGTPase